MNPKRNMENTPRFTPRFGRVPWWFKESPDACAISGIFITCCVCLFVIAQVRLLNAEYYAQPPEKSIALSVLLETVEPFDINEQPEKKCFTQKPKIDYEELAESVKPIHELEVSDSQQTELDIQEPKKPRKPANTFDRNPPQYYISIDCWTYSTFEKIVDYWGFEVFKDKPSGEEIDTYYSNMSQWWFRYAESRNVITKNDGCVYIRASRKASQAIHDAEIRSEIEHGEPVKVQFQESKVWVTPRYHGAVRDLFKPSNNISNNK